MATPKIDEIVRERHMKLIEELLLEQDIETLRIATNQIVIPVIHEDEELWVRITLAIPKGARGGDPFDGYFESEMFLEEQAEKEEKAKLKEIAKEKKKKQDAKRRETLKQQKEEREKKGE